MQLQAIPSPLFSLILAIFSTPSQISAVSIPILDELMPDLSFNQLSPRACANPCGFYGQVCCSAGQYCFTDSNNQAQCGNSPQQTSASAAPAQSGGSWQMFTTTYVQTDLTTVTSTYSSLISSAPTTNQGSQSSGVACRYSLGETECGSTCCSAGQFCDASRQCVANGGGGSSGAFSTLYTVTTSAANTGSAPLRPTSGTVITVTSTGSATTTVPFQTPVGTDGGSLVGAEPSSSGGGLSGGAIAGIVIGVLLGIALLIALCVCCLLKGCLDGLLGLLGLRNNRRRREETYIEERRTSHHHHGAAGAAGAAYAGSDRRRGGRTWFGTRPSRVTEKRTEKKTGGLGGLAGVGAGLGTLALILGLKRRRDQKRRDEGSVTTGYGSSYYSDEYTTSASEYLRNLSSTYKVVC